MKKSNKVIVAIVAVIASLVSGLAIGKATNKKVVETVEVEKVVNVPVEVVKEVEVIKEIEKPIVKTVVKEVKSIEYVDRIVPASIDGVYTEEEMNSELWDNIMQNHDIYVYYMNPDDNSFFKCAYFKKGTKFTKFNRVGRYPIIYSVGELY